MIFSSEEVRSLHTYALKDIAPDLPSDWTDYQYLILELKISNPQRFFVGMKTKDSLYANGIQPFSSLPVRFCIPLDYYRKPPASGMDMAATFNKIRPLGMINIGSRVGPLVGVDSISFYMVAPVGNPTLGIYSIALSMDDPGDKILQERYLVDAFGQWSAGEWPEKVKTQDELLAAWKQEESELKPLSSGVSEYGGFTNLQLRATGYFRTEKVDGKWWFVDPLGYPFLSVGVNGMRPSSRTLTKGRESIFACLPDTSGFVDFHSRNVNIRYGSAADSLWATTTLRRMQAWGLNTVGNWSAPQLLDRNTPFVVNLRGLLLERGIMGLADIYAPEYAATIDRAIQTLTEPYKDNPWPLGYFVGNEQPWPGNETLLCDRILAGNDTPIKKALQAYLEQHGNTPEAKLAFAYETFDKFLGLVKRIGETRSQPS
jgi:hypothetical protein